jgi:hypothetical protein
VRVERFPIANEELDRAEMAVKEALAEIDAHYRRDAEPWLKRLADIEGARQYRTILMPDPDDAKPVDINP